MPGKEQYVFTRPDGTRLVLPQHFRPVESSPRDPPYQPERAYGYPDVFDGYPGDDYEEIEAAIFRLRGRVKAATETALRSTMTDWRRLVAQATLLTREVEPGVALRPPDAIHGGRLTWAFPDGLPSNFADVQIACVLNSVDALLDMKPAR